jgi:hypothetical protein
LRGALFLNLNHGNNAIHRRARIISRIMIRGPKPIRLPIDCVLYLDFASASLRQAIHVRVVWHLDVHADSLWPAWNRLLQPDEFFLVEQLLF